MARMQLPEDFRDFFKFLNDSGVEYYRWKISSIANKKASARPKDMADLDALES